MMDKVLSELEALPRHGTSHAALVADILDVIRSGEHAGLSQPAMMPVGELSRSELRVLRYLPTNLTRREIAGELSVSVHTVDSHIRRVYAKLGAADRTVAVQRGRELLGRSRPTALERPAVTARAPPGTSQPPVGGGADRCAHVT